MYKQGVILELRKKEAVVFNEYGEYEKIERKDGMVVGQVVEYQKTSNINKKRLISVISAAAVLIAIYFSYGLYQYSSQQVFVYVTLDIKPSLEFSIDNENCVIDLKPLNSDAKKIAKAIKVKGKNIEIAITDVINEMEENEIIGLKSDDIVVLSTSASDLWDEEDERNIKINETRTLVEKTVKSCTNSYAVVETINATPEMRKLSIEADMSLGRYALYAKAIEGGYNISLQDAKTVPLSQLIEYSKTKENNLDKVDNAQKSSNDLSGLSTAELNDDIDRDIKDLAPQKSETDSYKPKVGNANNESLTNKHDEVKNPILDSTLNGIEKDERLPKASPTITRYDEIQKFTPSPTVLKHDDKIPSTSVVSTSKCDEAIVTPTPDLHMPRHDKMPNVSSSTIIPKHDDDRPKFTPGPTMPEIDETIKNRPGNTMPPYNDKIPRPEIEERIPEHLDERGITCPNIKGPEKEQVSPKPLPTPIPDTTEIKQTPIPDYSEPESTFEDHGPSRNREFIRKRTGKDLEMD